MPPRKGKQAKGDQLKGAREAKLEKEVIAESDTALDKSSKQFRRIKGICGTT
jgi:hypothetical protein